MPDESVAVWDTFIHKLQFLSAPSIVIHGQQFAARITNITVCGGDSQNELNSSEKAAEADITFVPLKGDNHFFISDDPQLLFANRCMIFTTWRRMVFAGRVTSAKYHLPQK